MVPQEAVIAGSQPFVDVVLPLLAERLGGSPCVADTPEGAVALCEGGANLLVYEHTGRPWLSACQALRRAGIRVSVIAALPPEQAGDVSEISAEAAAVVAWHGDGRPVVEALGRVLAVREAAAAAAASTPSGPRGATPVVRRSTGTPPPSPAVTPWPRPMLTPSRPMAPVPEAAQRPATLTPAPAPVSTTAVPRAAVTGPIEEIPFEALFDDEELAEPAAPVAPTFRSSLPPPSAVWPATVLSATDGLAVVRAALSGLWPEKHLRPVTEKVVASLSTAEKAAAQGNKLPFDSGPIARAVGLRWRVAAAIETRPPLGSKIDEGAVQEILVGIDDALVELKSLGEDSGSDARRALDAVRHGLVKEAIDLTEALQQVAPAAVVEEITSSRKARRTTPPAVTRTVAPSRAPEREPRQVPWVLIALLVVAVVGAGAYHGLRLLERSKGMENPVSGAPSGTAGLATPQYEVLAAPAGAPVDPKDLERFRAQEKARGNEVREISPGIYVVAPEANPGSQSAQPGAPRGGKP